MEDEFYPYKPKGFRYKRINSYFPFCEKCRVYGIICASLIKLKPLGLKYWVTGIKLHQIQLFQRFYKRIKLSWI